MNKDLINGGNAYKNIAHFCIENTDFNYNILKQNAILFCNLDYSKILFNNLQYTNNKYILITHCTDHLITENAFLNKPSCIKKWYSHTAIYDHPDLIQIPGGFGVHYDYPGSDEYYTNWVWENAERLRNKEKNNEILYCNYSTKSIITPREYIVPLLISNGNKCYVPEDKKTVNGRLLFIDYCEDMAKYKFIISPPGNAIDSHKTWMAIYFGCIPIVLKHKIYKDFNLPILEVNSYNEVTEDLLRNYLKFYENQKFNYEQCTISYWKNKILTDFKNL